MTRRDTIIITTLVNAGLLACLFVTATREEESILGREFETHEVAEAAATPLEAYSAYITDDVDQALKAFMPPPAPPSILTDDDTADKIVSTPPPPEETVAPVPAATDAKYVEVKVKKGDFLEKIAKANGSSVSAIKQANNLKSDKLTVGQTLKIPVEPLKSKPEKVKESPVVSLAGDTPVYYTIQSGDNPWKIAKKFHVRFEDILRLNNMTEENSKLLKVGQEIRVK
jgi:LysM repeat protein